MSKEQLYMIVLLDILGYNNAGASETPKLVDDVITYSSFFADSVEILPVIDAVLSGKLVPDKLPGLPIVEHCSDLILSVINTSQDKKVAVQYLLGFALQCQNSIDTLNRIASDTSNDSNLRNAANKVIEIIENAYSGTLQELIDKDMGIQYVNDFATVAINVLWDYGCSFFLPLQVAQWVADGVKITLDLFYDTGVSVDAYYKLQVTCVIENALRNQINSLDGDYLRRENLNQSSTIYAAIDMYRSAILKGYEYTLDYLNSVGKDSEYISASLEHNTRAFEQFENEIEDTYYSLYEC